MQCESEGLETHPSSAFRRRAAIRFLSSSSLSSSHRCFNRFSCSFFSLVACSYKDSNPH